MELLAFGDTGWGDELFYATLMTIAVSITAMIIGFSFAAIFTPLKLSKNKINLHYLCTWKDVLDAARMGNYFEKDILDEVELFLNNPLDWQK